MNEQIRQSSEMIDYHLGKAIALFDGKSGTIEDAIAAVRNARQWAESLKNLVDTNTEIDEPESAGDDSGYEIPEWIKIYASLRDRLAGLSAIELSDTVMAQRSDFDRVTVTTSDRVVVFEAHSRTGVAAFVRGEWMNLLEPPCSQAKSVDLPTIDEMIGILAE